MCMLEINSIGALVYINTNIPGEMEKSELAIDNGLSLLSLSRSLNTIFFKSKPLIIQRIKPDQKTLN